MQSGSCNVFAIVKARRGERRTWSHITLPQLRRDAGLDITTTTLVPMPRAAPLSREWARELLGEDRGPRWWAGGGLVVGLRWACSGFCVGKGPQVSLWWACGWLVVCLWWAFVSGLTSSWLRRVVLWVRPAVPDCHSAVHAVVSETGFLKCI